MQRRRDFLKLLAASSGGLFLSGCGRSGNTTSGGPGGGFTGNANGYVFIPLLDTGMILPDGRKLDALPGGVLINGAGQILFHAMTGSGMGLYELTPDYSSLTGIVKEPAVQVRKIVAQGDPLPDGTVATGVGVAVSNVHGNHAVVLRHDQKTRSVFFERKGSGLHKVAGFRTLVPGGAGLRFGGIFGDVDLNDQDDLMLVDHFTRQGRTSPGQGLFLLPQAQVDSNTRLLLSTDDLLPDAPGSIAGFGLVDINSLGNYVAHVVASSAQPAVAGALPPQGLVHGHTADPLSPRLLIAPSSFQAAPRGASHFFTLGSSVYGARLAHLSDDVAHIVHQSQDRLALFINGQVVASVGDVSPGGSIIRGFSGPVLQPDGALFGVAITDDGHELARLSAGGSQVLLSRGDALGARVVNSIIFGLHSDQVDRQGRLVFIGEFMDGSSAVVLGLPV